MQLTEHQTHALLNDTPVARLATITEANLPHVVPVVFCLWQGCVRIPVDGKRKGGRELKRLRNVRANPTASLLIDHYAEDWQQLWWLRIDGRADVWTPGSDDHAAAYAQLSAKYPQYGEPEFARLTSQWLTVHIDTTQAWSQSGIMPQLTEPST